MKEIISYLKPYRRKLALAIAVIALSTFCSLMLPMIMSSIVNDGVRVGYTAVSASGGKLFISKLYLLKENRGRGFGTHALDLLFDLARGEGLSSVYLTVNKYNDRAIRTYESNGFEKVQSIVTDIGEGFVMDDYVMEKTL